MAIVPLAADQAESDQKPLALLIHGWDDDPNKGWLKWLWEKLEASGYRVIAPYFENKPPLRVERWEDELAQIIPQLRADSIVIGHSLGCWLALQLLSKLAEGQVIRSVYLVSGFFDAPDARAGQYFSKEPDWVRLKATAGHWVCIYSDDDRIVTPDRTRRLAHQLAAELVCVPGHGHFLGSRGMDKLPELWEMIEDDTPAAGR